MGLIRIEHKMHLYAVEINKASKPISNQPKIEYISSILNIITALLL